MICTKALVQIPDTYIALYADDTKIWQSIKNEEDIAQLQRDINILYLWLLNNKIKFYSDKCKVVTIKHRPSPLAMLPFVAYHYQLAETLIYIRKCKQVNILPLFCRFNLNDVNLFHEFVYKTIPINMPDYLTLYNGNSRLCSTNLDNLSFVTNIASTATRINNLNKYFFFRSHTFWNSLPFDIRNSISL